MARQSARGAAGIFKIVCSLFPRSGVHGVTPTSADDAPRPLSKEQNVMPLVDIYVVRGLFTAEQKRTIISKITDVLVAVEGEHIRDITRVKINEFEIDRDAGSEPLTARAIQAR
jgi:4-oxalocrotonate tautomerase